MTSSTPPTPVPLGLPDSGFLWAVGIEDTFIPQVRPGLRRLEEYELTQHDRFWKEDLDRVAASGARGLRWGIPWYRVEPAMDRFDWRWTDEVLDYAVNVKGLTIVLDLVHYGTPLWLDNSFLNARYAERVAAYAAAVTRRYGSLIRHYTPVNEPIVNADFCGRRGEWPPYLTGDDGFVKLCLAIARGAVLTANAIRAERSDAVLVQVEACQVVRPADPANPALAELAAHADEEPFLSFDLATGRLTDDHPLRPFVERHGATPEQLRWLRDHGVGFDVFGLNYYPWSNSVLVAGGDGRVIRRRGERSGAALAGLARRVHERYGLPIMVTETSSPGAPERRARWMDETIAAIGDLRRDGVPIVGYTWFPLFAMVDWAYRTGRRPLASYALNLGLYDGAFGADGILSRTELPLVGRYRRYASGLPEDGLVEATRRAPPKAVA